MGRIQVAHDRKLERVAITELRDTKRSQMHCSSNVIARPSRDATE